MKAFICNDVDYDLACLIYSNNRNLVKMLACGELGIDYIDVRIRRNKELDGHYEGKTVEYRAEILRLAGFYNHGDSGLSCDTCGLYSMGIDKFEVCEKCHQCKECGCDCV